MLTGMSPMCFCRLNFRLQFMVELFLISNMDKLSVQLMITHHGKRQNMKYVVKDMLIYLVVIMGLHYLMIANMDTGLKMER